MSAAFRFVAAVLVAVLPASAQEAPAPRERPPNVVLVLADDLGWRDTATYGSRFYKTASVQRLAERGMLFSDAYAPAPVCSPSRASILTGRSPGRLRIARPMASRGEELETVELPASAPPSRRLLLPPNPTHLPLVERTLAELLADAGYATGHVGKWHLGRPTWGPEAQGFAEVYGGHHASASRYTPPFDAERLRNIELDEGDTYLTDVLTDVSLDFVRAHAEEPFFLNLWHYAVHNPFQGKRDLIRKYARRVREDDPQSYPTMGAMVHSLDQSLGRILDELERLGIAEDTIVIFTSDNGGLERALYSPQPPTSNLPLRDGKGSLYEGGVRVPLIVSWPGVIEAGSRSAVPVTSTDLLPTLRDLAGLKGDEEAELDGESLAPLLRGTGELEREALFWHSPNAFAASTVRRGRYKLVRLYGAAEDKAGTRLELYDLETDLGEQHDLSVAEPELTAELDALLSAHLERTGALVPRPNPDFDPALEVADSDDD